MNVYCYQQTHGLGNCSEGMLLSGPCGRSGEWGAMFRETWKFQIIVFLKQDD